MRLFLLLALLGLAMVATAIPISPEDEERPTRLLDLADAGDSHSNDADRLARHGWGGGGWGGGWGGRGWGGGWGGRGWGGGGWGGGGWGGGGWGGGWGGGRWGGGGWGHWG